MKRICVLGKRGRKVSFPYRIYAISIFISLLLVTKVYAQTPIDDATTEVSEYFDDAVDLMYAVGALLGLVGAIKVYSKWNSGDQDTGKVAASWFGSCIFLIVVATVLRAFFIS